MVSVSFAASAAMFLALAAVELFRFLHLRLSVPSTSTSTQDSTLDRAVESTASDIELFFPFQVLMLLVATVVLFAAVAFVHLRHAGGGAMGAGNKRISELATFLLCGAAGTLNFILFVLQPAAGVLLGDVGALVRALGAAAADALPAVATVTFYLSITLVIAHIRAGGEGGGTGAAANHRDVPASVYLLKKLALGAAAALLIQMAMALLFK